MRVGNKEYRTVWMENGVVKLINQPLLPHKFEVVDCKNYKETAKAIKDMTIRGAGAIGGAAGFGFAQGILEAKNEEDIEVAYNTVKNTRPTAQNLFYAINRIKNKIKNKTLEESQKIAVKEAQAIADEDAESCKKIGENGEKLIKDNSSILTHCNAGWLAFVDYGTALSPIYAAHNNGKKLFVFVDETRPRNQGAMLTAWELGNENVPHAVIADNAAGHYMKTGKVSIVITGADRIAANGDVANKIGTYEKAVLAKENNIPFYVAAPIATIDLNCKTGEDIPIEERSQEEVHYMFGWNDGKLSRVRITPSGSSAMNPAFDITPAKYVTGIITEKGIIRADKDSIKALKRN